ncbi:MAG: hypothetical protein ACYCZ7_01185 [Minisyncoccota bacterium]
MEINSVRFRVVKVEVGAEKTPIKVVKVFAAPAGTKLHGLGGSDVYVTVSQLHYATFQSRLIEGSKTWEQQKRIWDFLSDAFIKAGLKGAPREKPTQANTQKPLAPSASIEDFRTGVLGMYCFEDSSPRAKFEVKFTPYRPKGKVFQAVKDVLCVKLVSVEPGHPLYEYCRPGTRLFHEVLSWKKTPGFNGPYAGDLQKMWELLTDMIAVHRVMQTPAIAVHLSDSSATVGYSGNA